MKNLASLIFILTPITLSGAYLIQSAPERVDRLNQEYKTFSPPPLSNLKPSFIDIITLGHKHVYDDFINLWLLQALLDENKPANVEQAMLGIRSVVQHQPKLETIYMLSCIVMFDDYKEPKHCQEIILEGLKAFPTSWRLPMLQGYVHAVLLEEPAQAASFFLMAASRPKAPSWVQRLAKKLIDQKNIRSEDLDRSIEILEQSPNSGVFKGILKRMKTKIHVKKDDS